MSQASKSYRRYIGADVGKTEIVIFDSQSKSITTLANRPAQMARFMAGLDATCLVVCEATGGYESELLTAALNAGIAIHRADARKVKAFIRSFGTIGKSDAIDARALASYGQERQAKLPLWQDPPPARALLQSLVLTRADLMKDRVAYNNRIKAPGMQAAKHHLVSILNQFKQQLKMIDAEIKNLIAANPQLTRDSQTIQSVPGLGKVNTPTLLALLPELGTLGRRQIAALAGLAPHPKQSGAKDGYRRTRGGRPQVRHALFMAGLSATRKTSPLNPFYQKLINNGKKKLVAIVAVMRKIVVIANARLRDQNQII